MRILLVRVIAVMVFFMSVNEALPASAADPGKLAEFVGANNHFSTDLYAQLSRQQGNLFFSPDSIATVLALAYGGARGDTAAEMARTLHCSGMPAATYYPHFATLHNGLMADAKKSGYQLNLANAMWVEKDFPLLKDFLTLSRSDATAAVNPVDFSGQPEQARETINQWVAARTAGKIKDLLPPESVSGATLLILTNAVYFKGDWAAPFDQATQNQDFFVTPQKIVKVPLMHGKQDFFHWNGPDFQIAALPYSGNHLSMVIFLPRARDGLPALEEKLTAENIRAWSTKLAPVSDGQIFLPRFKVAAAGFSVKAVLEKLGMKTAFALQDADFSGIDGRRDLFIGDVLHKAFIDVNEKGTEAAAATAVVMLRNSMQIPSQSVLFRADHPFIYLIRDNRTGAILFMGRMVDPTR